VTTRTRRLVLLAALVVALTIPTEMVLLQAISQDDRTAASRWAEGLSTDSLVTASGRLQDLPVQYRKALLRSRPPKNAKPARCWPIVCVSCLARTPSGIC